MAITILLVEKDASRCERFQPDLEREGYRVTTARSHRQALQHARAADPTLLVLDVASFGDEGYKVWEALRGQLHEVPTVLLLEKGYAGACRSGELLMEPPFTSRKLLFRVRKLCKDLDPCQIMAGPLALEPESCVLTKGGQTMQLRRKEARLLAYLMRNSGKVLERQEIMREVWDKEDTDDTRTLNVHVRWLRVKIEEDPSQPCMLRTVRGVGYCLDVPRREAG